jgi:ADP-heptose:LPS heptosyltransferase
MRKTLIVRVCAIGDFVFNLPALIAIQKMEPNTRFTLVGNTSILNLAKSFVAVDAIHSIELQPWAKLFYEPIPDLDFADAIVWMKDPVVAENLRASGIPNVIRENPFPAFGHAADHLLRTLRLPRPALPDLWNPHADDIFVHPGSGSSSKQWPHFPELMTRLKTSRAISQTLSLPDLMSEILRCRAFVGNDSGITHLAALIGCPTTVLFGPTDPRTWGPIGRRSRVIWKRKLEDISVDEVLLSVYGTHARTR